MKRIGIIGQNHSTGIGIQAGEFARNMGISKVLITDLAKLHAANSRNEKNVTYYDWFSGFERMTVEGIPDEQACRWLLEDIDVLFVIETPLNWEIFDWARQMGVKSFLQTNVEFLEPEIRPVPLPDVFLLPTPWMKSRVEKYGETIVLPVPIATDRLKRREITKANLFIHVGGYKAYMDRDGTEIVQHCGPYLGAGEIKIFNQAANEVEHYWDLYNEGDVMVLPRRYGGLSLKLQEAAAVGMPIIVTEKDPYAPEDCTVTVPGPYELEVIILRGSIGLSSADPERLGHTITELARRDSIEELSEKAYNWAQNRSWEKMIPKYQEVLQ